MLLEFVKKKVEGGLFGEEGGGEVDGKEVGNPLFPEFVHKKCEGLKRRLHHPPVYGRHEVVLLRRWDKVAGHYYISLGIHHSDEEFALLYFGCPVFERGYGLVVEDKSVLL